MPSPPWFNENENRAYPFTVRSVDQPPSGPTTVLNLPDALVVDCGFVAGPLSRFETKDHSVYLARVSRTGSVFSLEFQSNAPALLGTPLVFTRDVSDPDYSTSFEDSGFEGFSQSSLSDSQTGRPCDEPLWSGFLVTGKMSEFALLLPSNGTIDRGTGGGVVEPALVQNLSESVVTRLAIANDDRTRAEAPPGCDAVVYPYPTGLIYVNADCVVGDVAFKPGFNSVVTQSLGDNSITLGAGVGRGEGEPCDTIPLFPGESPPDGSTLVEGGPRCNETIRSINGLGGPQVSIFAGAGVTVTPLPNENKLIIDVTLSGLAIQIQGSARSESC